MKYAYFFIALAVMLLFNSCKSDDFENTKRVITTDKEEYRIGDQFELTLTIYPLEGEKQIRIYKNYKNLEISFALVGPSKGIQNEDWSPHSGQSLKESEIMEISVSKDKPFTKTFVGKIEDRNSEVVLSIPELNLLAPFNKAKILDGTSVRIHGFCNPISPVFADALEDYFEVKDIRIVDASKNTSSDQVEGNLNCARGQAQSVVKKNIFPNALFKLNDDNRTGTETINLKGGEKLIIRNWGCEYYVLTFRFETERFKRDTTDIRYWLGRTMILMEEIENGLDAPLDIPGGILAFKNLLKEDKEYRLGDEVVSREGEIRSFTTFDRVQKINDKKFGIEISYATGPL